MKIFSAIVTLLISFSSVAFGGEFIGNLILLPDGCQQTDARICKLGAELTYKSSRDGLVWQTDTWKDEYVESGTTDGASIPKWAQAIIGDPYDKSYLKAAIIHDHYCYKENHVRTWEQTHLMFYDALVDLKVNIVKAKTMYFAVYLAGPHWIKIVPGENCGHNCVKSFFPTGERWEGDEYANNEFQKEIKKMKLSLENDVNISIEEIEDRANKIKLNNFFFENSGIYKVKSKNDPNLRSSI